MSNIALVSPATGTATFSITTPSGTSTDRTLTLPDNSGTVLTTATPGVPVDGPAFYVATSSSQSVSSGVTTRLTTLGTEVFDTNACFASNRFTPNVAGYYSLTAVAALGGGAIENYVYFYKNGSQTNTQQSVAIDFGAGSSTLVYMNGSTDYIDLYVLPVGATKTYNASFSGFLARGA
jgi:hypothetical protein